MIHALPAKYQSSIARTAGYSANSKNQYTSRGVPPYIEVAGIAKVDATVTVEGSASGVYRHGEYFRKELNVDNSSAAQYPTIEVDTDLTSPVSGKKFLPATAESFTHDADGNLTQDGRWDYVWDGENRLVKMRSRSGSPATERRIEFEYDWQGRRIRQTVWNDRDDSEGSEVSDTLYLYDGWNLIAELNANSSNAKVRTYIWGLDLSGTMQGAGGVGGLLMVLDHTGTTKRHFAAYDGNGNVMALVDSTTGDWSGRYEYGPFGEPIRASGDFAYANPFRFSTKFTDGETGMLYYGYRFYNASTGRWLNRDPIGEEGGINIYGFVDNDPLNYIDMVGLACRETKLSFKKSIPLEGFSAEFGFKATIKKCDDCCTYVDLNGVVALMGGIKYEDSAEVSAAGFTFGYSVSAAITAGRIERRGDLNLALCPGRVEGKGRVDIIMLDFGMGASGSGSIKAIGAGIFDFSGSAALGFNAEAKLGLAAKIEKVGDRCLDVSLLGNAFARAKADLYLQGRGYIKAGKWKLDLFEFNLGYKDKLLGQGGFIDAPIWHDRFCL